MEYASRRMALRTERARRTAAMPRSSRRLWALQAMVAATNRAIGTQTAPRHPRVRNHAADAGE